MKILITGAPGVGKSSLARRVQRNLAKEGFEFKIVDGYVDKLAKRTGLAYGYFATYWMNFSVLFERLLAEQEATRSGHNNIITVGSIFETTVYSGLHHNREWYGSPEDLLAHIEGKALMEALSVFCYQTYDYDVAFRLPYNKVQAKEHEGWDYVMDQKLPEVIDGFMKYATVLSGTEKERVKFATDIVAAFCKDEAAQDVERSV